MSEVEAGSNAAPLESVVDTQNIEQSEEVTNQQSEAQKTGNPKIDDPWPDSARNKVGLLIKQNTRLKERSNHEITQLRRELEQFRAAQQKETPKIEEPKEDDFDNYGDYLKAVARYKPQEQHQVDPKKIHEQAFQQAQEKFYYDQKVQQVATQAQKAMQEYPELEGLLEEHSDILDAYPPAIEMAFLEAENAPAAFYALAKEGRLEQLAHMSPIQAARVIAQAEARGEQMLKAGKVSKAPAPIQGARPNAASAKPLNQMKWSELKKNLDLRG